MLEHQFDIGITHAQIPQGFIIIENLQNFEFKI